MSEEEQIEQAISNLTRGNDIESAIYILERCALDGLIIRGCRVNIYKMAVRQILNFLDEYKNKGYLDVVREKVKANNLISKLQADIEIKDKVIDLMAKCIQTDEKDYEDFCSGCKYDNEDCHGDYCKERTIEYFYKKAEEKK